MRSFNKGYTTMCVIVHKEKDVKIDLETLRDIVDTNPDGLGVSFWDNKDKSWSTVKYLKPKTKDLKNVIATINNTEAVIHSRIATSGGVTSANIHPFIGKRYTLFHNGIISSLNGILDKFSDTRLLHKLLEMFEFKQASEMLKSLATNSRSKFILIDNKTNNVYRFGKFEKYEGLWCSNLYFTPQITYKGWWEDTPCTSHKNDITKVLSKDIIDKITKNYGRFEDEDLQLIAEELEWSNLEPTWENVKDIIHQWYYYE